jgi:adhesin/invasin
MVSLQMIARTRPIFLSLLAVLVVASGCQRVPLLAPSGSTITLTTSATTLPANGTVTILAQVIEPAGTPPHSGTHITFTTTLGTIQPSDVETDINGTATVTFNAGVSSGTATITASSGGATTGTAGAIKIAIGAAAVGRISVGANPGTVAGSGGTSLITASVSDASGNALPFVPVTFTTTNGSFSASVVNTDSNGNAQTTLTTNKTATVTATAGVQGTPTPAPAPTTPGTPTGGTTSTQQSATVTVNVNALSSIAVGQPSPASPFVGQTVGFALTYTQNANGSPVARVIVDFGDGSPAQTFTGQPATVTHTYNIVGAFVVRVTAIDTFGDIAGASGGVTVLPRPQIVVGITVSANPVAGTATTFTITATPTPGAAITSVAVDLGDGTRRTLSGNVATLQYAYAAPGPYLVTAIATDSSGATGSTSTSVVVGSQLQPTVSLTTVTTNPTAGTDVTFTATVAPAAATGTVIRQVLIDFGEPGVPKTDLGAATGTIALHHVYQNGGTYTVVLTATDSNGGVGTAVTTIFVQTATPLTVLLSAATTPGTPNTLVSFTATVIGLGNSVVVNYHWVFGGISDGTLDTSSNQTTKSYPTGSGPRTVSVTVTTSTGAQATGTTVITP